MKISTCATETHNTVAATDELIATIKADQGDALQAIQVAYTDQHDPNIISSKLRTAFPAAQILGSSSYHGVFTEKGIFGFDGPAIGAMSIGEHDGSIGTAAAQIPENASDEDVLKVIQDAAMLAQVRADRVGELPDLVWISMCPGREEMVIKTVMEIFGEGTQLVGMTTADNDFVGNWSLFDQSIQGADAIAFTLFYTTDSVTHYIQSGFKPGKESGIATSADGRNLHTIDGRPAVEVFKEWAGDCILETGQVSYELMGLCSFGHIVAQSEFAEGVVIEDYRLISPVLTDGNTLIMVAEVDEGDRLFLMRGEMSNLHLRLANVSSQTLQKVREHGTPAGAMMVMCAGYAMSRRDAALQSIKSIVDSVDGVPLLGIMGYGEQGTFMSGKPVHGNWMVSSTVFTV